VGENSFLNLAAECFLILDYSIRNFFDVNNINFISIGRKSTKFVICNGLVCFELGLDRLERSNHVKSKKDRPMYCDDSIIS